MLKRVSIKSLSQKVTNIYYCWDSIDRQTKFNQFYNCFSLSLFDTLLSSPSIRPKLSLSLSNQTFMPRTETRYSKFHIELLNHPDHLAPPWTIVVKWWRLHKDCSNLIWFIRHIPVGERLWKWVRFGFLAGCWLCEAIWVALCLFCVVFLTRFLFSVCSWEFSLIWVFFFEFLVRDFWWWWSSSGGVFEVKVQNFGKDGWKKFGCILREKNI